MAATPSLVTVLPLFLLSVVVGIVFNVPPCGYIDTRITGHRVRGPTEAEGGGICGQPAVMAAKRTAESTEPERVSRKTKPKNPIVLTNSIVLVFFVTHYRYTCGQRLFCPATYTYPTYPARPRQRHVTLVPYLIHLLNWPCVLWMPMKSFPLPKSPTAYI